MGSEDDGRPAGPPASEQGTPPVVSARRLVEVLRVHPLLYNLFYDLGGDLEMTRKKIEEVHREDPHVLLMAAEIAGRALLQFPNHMFLCYVNGVLAIVNHRPLAGAGLLKKVLDLARKADDHAAALATLDALDAVFPAELFLAERRTEVLLASGRPGDAVAHLCQTAERLSAMGEVEVAAEFWWKAYLIDRSQPASLYRAGDAIKRVPVPASGLAVVDRLLKQDPDDAVLVSVRAILLARDNARDRSALEFERAEDLARDLVDHLMFVHRAAMHHASLEVARRCGHRLAELDPDGSRRRLLTGMLPDGRAEQVPPPAVLEQAPESPLRPAAAERRSSEAASRAPQAEPSAPGGVHQRTSSGATARILVWSLGITVLLLISVPIYQLVRDEHRTTLLAREFLTVKRVLQELELERRPYTENVLGPLVRNKRLLEEPLDPWGHEFLFDWVNQRLISTGENGLLETAVAGLPPPASEPGISDDHVQPLWDTSDWFVGPALADEQRALRNFVLGASDGSEPTHRFSGRVMNLDVSPDRRKILACVVTSTTAQAMLLDRGKEAYVALRLPLPHVEDAVWSGAAPDQMVVEAARTSSPSEHELYLTNVSGDHPVALTTELADAREPTIDTDTGTLMFIGTRDGRRTLLRMALATRKLEVFEADATKYRAPALSPGGSYLALVVQSGERESLEVIDLAQRERVMRWTGVMPGSRPVWSWDGERIAALSAEPKGRLWIGHAKKGRMAPSSLASLAPVRFCWMTASSAVRRESPGSRSASRSGTTGGSTDASATTTP